MRTLLVGKPEGKPEDGGSFSYQSILQAGFNSIETSHLYYYVEAKKTNIQNVVNQLSIDFVWFMSPFYERIDVPFAITVWDLGHRIVPWFPEVSVSGWTYDDRENFYNYVLQRASIVVIGNNTGANQINRSYNIPLDRIKLIPLPVRSSQFLYFEDESHILNEINLKRNEYLLYPAQFWPHKNHITLIDAIELLIAKGQKKKLVFTGSDKGNLNFIKEYINSKNLNEFVIIAGFLKQSDLNMLYKNAFALTFASLMGPDNLPPIEAMQFGCPVICSNYQGSNDQLGDAALYFDGLDPFDLVNKLEALVNPALRNQLIESGSRLVNELTEKSYFEKINNAVNEFSKTRRLWSGSNSYKHT
jgi:glycosyltransferase involved in cell wall biosynthesis